MTFNHWICLVIVIAVTSFNHVNGKINSPAKDAITYSILGSQFIRPNSKYFVSVHLHESEKPVTFQVSIQDSSTERNILLSQNVTLEPFSTRTIAFQTEQLNQPNYVLVAEGLSGIVFRNETKLWLNEKSVSIHVQTDRPEYAVGDKIKFRVLILNVETKPVTVNRTLSVHLKNTVGDVVSTWLNQSTFQGVFNGETIVTDSGFGKWQLIAEYSNQSQVTTFNVIQLRPYTFQITIDTKPSIVYADKVLGATINVKKHGQPVKGVAHIRLASLFAHIHDGVELIQSKHIEPNGKVSVDFKLNQLNFDELYYRELELSVDVTDTVTGLSSNCTTHIQVHTNSYYFTQINVRQFSPGLPFSTIIKVFRHDKNPIKDLSRPLRISYSSNEQFENSISNEYRLDENGQLIWSVQIPKNYSELYAKAEYEGLSDVIGILDAENSPVHAFLQLNVVNNEAHIGKEIEVEVLSTDEISWLTYLLVGRFGCFQSETIKILNEKRVIIRLQTDFRMYPDVQLIAYYIKQGHLVSEGITLSFRKDFTNIIRLDTSSARIDAGGELEVTIETTPGSLVSFTAIDQSRSVHPGKAIDADYVAYDLLQYNEMYYDIGYRGNRIQYWLSDKTETVFTEHNIVVLSNVIPPYSREPVYDDFEPYVPFEPEDNWLRNSFEMANSWLFTSLNISSSKEVRRYQVPANQKSWAISAIALHPEAGFGLLQNELIIKIV